MGLRDTAKAWADKFSPSRAVIAGEVIRAAAGDVYPLTSWTGGASQLTNLPTTIAEAFGINTGTTSDRVSRKEAMSIPAVRRARQVIAGTLGSTRLIAHRTVNGAAQRIDRAIVTRPDPNATREWMLTWTIDDLMFYGVAFWYVTGRDSLGYPVTAVRIDPTRINLTAGSLTIDGQPVSSSSLIRFDGPDEGLLTTGARSLRTYIMLEDAVRKFARLDVPLGFFEDSVGGLEVTEVQSFLNTWESARAVRTTGYVPPGLSYKTPGFKATDIELTAARQAQATEVARLTNLPASYLNAPAGDSLTYNTTEAARRELVDISFAPYSAAICARLSMPDVTPTGTDVDFDLGDFLRGDLAATLAAAKIAIDAGLMTPDEIRRDWLHLPPKAQENANAPAA